MDILESFGEFIRKARSNKYTQRELAKLLEIGYPYLSKLESGVEKYPSEKLLYQISEILNINASEVFLNAKKLPSNIENMILSDSTLFNKLLYLHEKSIKNNFQVPGEIEYFFYNSKKIMLLIDPDTAEIVDMNPKAESFYQYSTNEFRKKRVFDLNILPENEVRENMKQAKSGNQNYFKLKHRIKSGFVKNILVISEPVVVHNKEYLHSIIIDQSNC